MPLDAVSATAAIAETHRSFTFAHLGATWQGALVLVGAVLALWWGWTRYGPLPSGVWGVCARTCRALGLALAVILLAGPSRQSVVETRIPGRALIAVDGSLSMSLADFTTPGGTTAARIAAAELVHQALSQRRYPTEWRFIGGLAGPWQPGLSASGASSPLGEELERLERRLVKAFADDRMVFAKT